MNYKNKNLIFSDRFIKTSKVTLPYDPDCLDLSSEDNKRLQNLIDTAFFLMEYKSIPYTIFPTPNLGI